MIRSRKIGFPSVSGSYTDEQQQINLRSSTTGIIADVRDIIEIDPADNTKLRIKAPYILVTSNSTVPTNITIKELNVPITSGVVHDIPPGFTYWIGVKDNSGVPLYNYHLTLEEFDLTEFAIIGRAFTDETIALQINGATGTFWWEGWNYGKTLYDFVTAKKLSFTISNGAITPDAGLLTYTREEGLYWRFMSYSSLKDPNKGTDPQTAVNAYFTYSSEGGFEETSTFEVGFIDDGAGGKTVVPVDKWSIYKVFHFASSNFESAQRGKQVYDSLHDAKSRKGEEDTAVNSDNINAAFTHIAFVKGDATDLTNINEVVFERIDLDTLSSGGDPSVGALQQSGVIDWVGAELLTVNGGDNTTFDIAEFNVGKVDRTTGFIRFIKNISAISAITVPNIATDPFSYATYNINTDSVVLSSSQVTRINIDNIIPLGRVWHRNNTNLDLVQSMQLVAETGHDYAGQLLAFGALKQSGLVATANGTNQKVNLSNGVIEVAGGTTIGSREGINIASPGGGSPLSFTPVHRAATNGKAILETVTSDINFDVFDDGSGTLAVVGNNKFSIHFLCIFPFRNTTDVFLIRGNKEYSTIGDARDGLLQDPIKEPSDFNGDLCIAAVIAKEGTTDLEAALTADDAAIASADRFGSFGAGGGGGAGSLSAVTLAAFSVGISANQTIATDTNTKVSFDNQVYDDGDNFNITTNQYTAPASGIHQFSTGFRYNNINDAPQGEILILFFVNNVESKRSAMFLSGNGTGSEDLVHGSFSVDLKLNAGDTVDVRTSHKEGADRIILGNFPGISWFMGHQLPATVDIALQGGWKEEGGVISQQNIASDVEVDGVLLFKQTLVNEIIADETIAPGEILRPSTATDSRAVRTTQSGDKRIIGVAVTAATLGNPFQMAVGGEFDVIINNTVTRGDFLEASSVSGRAVSTLTGGGPGDFAIAMQGGTSGQTIKARFKKSEVF